MKPARLLLILILLTGATGAQLEPDRSNFDIMLHPGEVEQKVLTLTNTGDLPISEITTTTVSGDAKEFIIIEKPKLKGGLEPGEDTEMAVFFLVPPEIKPGIYNGFFYLMDDIPPSMPQVIDFRITVTEQDSYGVSLTIDDARSASKKANPDKDAEFELQVKNTGRFRDVIAIDVLDLPGGWSATVLDDEEEVELPYKIPLSSGSSRTLSLKIEVSESAGSGTMTVTATSLGNQSQNSSVEARLKVGISVRSYDVVIDVPKVVAINRTYDSSITVLLERDERIRVEMVTDPSLLVVPSTLFLPLNEKEPKTSNFSVTATEAASYVLVVQMIDSMGVPFPPELVIIRAMPPEGAVIVTSSRIEYNALASLATRGDIVVPVVTLEDGLLNQGSRRDLYPYSDAIILGDATVVPNATEGDLAATMNVTRLAGADLVETSWVFASEGWGGNGTDQVVVSGPSQMDILKGYQVAKGLEAPLVLLDQEISERVLAIVQEMKAQGLSKAVLAGGVGDNAARALRDLGVETEAA